MWTCPNLASTAIGTTPFLHSFEGITCTFILLHILCWTTNLCGSCSHVRSTKKPPRRASETKPYILLVNICSVDKTRAKYGYDAAKLNKPVDLPGLVLIEVVRIYGSSQKGFGTLSVQIAHSICIYGLYWYFSGSRVTACDDGIVYEFAQLVKISNWGKGERGGGDGSSNDGASI